MFKLALAFETLLMAPFLLAEDFQGYLDGRDSVIGRAVVGLSALFQIAADAARTAFGVAFDWLLQQALWVGAQIAEALTPESVKFILGAVRGATGGAIGSMAPPPSAFAPPTQMGPPAGPTSTSITIVNPAPGEGLKLAGQVKGVLERGRDADLAAVF